MDITNSLIKLKNVLQSINSNVADRIVLKQEELTLNNTAGGQAASFTGLVTTDVVAIEIRVRKDGAPADSTRIARFTAKSGDVPTATHGMYLGDGDLYTISGNENCTAFKIIAMDALNPVCNIIYYGSIQKS